MARTNAKKSGFDKGDSIPPKVIREIKDLYLVRGFSAAKCAELCSDLRVGTDTVYGLAKTYGWVKNPRARAQRLKSRGYSPEELAKLGIIDDGLGDPMPSDEGAVQVPDDLEVELESKAPKKDSITAYRDKIAKFLRVEAEAGTELAVFARELASEAGRAGDLDQLSKGISAWAKATNTIKTSAGLSSDSRGGDRTLVQLNINGGGSVNPFKKATPV